MAGAGAVQTLAALPGAWFYLTAGAACAVLPVAARRWQGWLAGMLACLIAGLLVGAVNAALLAWEMLAISDDELAAKLAAKRAADTAKVLAANDEVEAKYNC